MRVLSGVQPTGNLHLGNYLGAIKRFVPLQDRADCYFCVVDLHAITAKHDPHALKQNTREIAAAYIAAGIDHKRSVVFAQSANPHHAELGWLLQCVARVGWLDRMTQFREKTGTNPSDELNAAVEVLGDFIYAKRDNFLDRVMRMPNGDYAPVEASLRVILDTLKDRRSHKEKASVGLYTYPVLQAADILLYRATHVPVGDDQKQHLNLAADIAKKFNHDYQHFNHRHFGEPVFTVPEPLIAAEGARIMNLRDGKSKMSKSDEDDMARINLSDDQDTIARKIKKATADTRPIPETEEELATMPTVRNMVEIMAAMREVTVADVLSEFEGKGYGVFKPALADTLIEGLSPIRSAMNNLLADGRVIDGILEEGNARAQVASRPVLARAKEAMGFW